MKLTIIDKEWSQNCKIYKYYKKLKNKSKIKSNFKN